MCLRARFLHVLFSAPVAVALTVGFAPLAHAQTSTPAKTPKPYVIVIDPGHGGSPNNADPNQLFDPGAIGVNGLEEKDVTLDISFRVQKLLQAEHVNVIMTRTTDKYVGIETRSAMATNAHADLFVSIHLNSFTSPTATGSLVLYPGPNSKAFATTMENAVGAAVAPSGVPNMGVQLRDDWWIHLTMPVATVESAYLSNPAEAQLLTTDSFRQTVAQGIVNGILAYKPDIRTRSAIIATAEKVHPAQVAAVPVGSATTGGTSIIRWLILLTIAGLAVYFRRPALHTAQVAYARADAWAHRGSRRSAARHRRALVRQRGLAYKAAHARRYSVYDELNF